MFFQSAVWQLSTDSASITQAVDQKKIVVDLSQASQAKVISKGNSVKVHVCWRNQEFSFHASLRLSSIWLKIISTIAFLQMIIDMKKKQLVDFKHF